VTADLETRRDHRARPLVESVSPQRVLRIAVLGAGHVGPVIARAAITAGYQVSIAASGDPENIALITQVLVPGAEPRWAADAVQKADIVVLAIPLHKFATFDSSQVAGKIVVDAMNYWPPIDGVQELFEDRQFGSSEIVAHRLSGSTIVKTLNQIGYHDLEDGRRPVGSPDRRALGVADSLRAGRVLEPGGPVFGASLRRAEFEAAVRAETKWSSPARISHPHSRQGT
jgi:8-hydroxy-5-deazaflavin:NADPH oxidoreductase